MATDDDAIDTDKASANNNNNGAIAQAISLPSTQDKDAIIAEQGKQIIELNQ